MKELLITSCILVCSLFCQYSYCQITGDNSVYDKYCYRAGGKIHVCVKLEIDSTFLIWEEKTGRDWKLNRYFGTWEKKGDTLLLKFIRVIATTPKDVKYFDKMNSTEKIVLYRRTDTTGAYWTLIKGNKVWKYRKLFMKLL